MIGVAEGFLLGKRLGLDVQKLFNIVSTSSGSCWAVNNYLPLPGPVPTSPANRDYQAGFTADNDAEGPEAGPAGGARPRAPARRWARRRRSSSTCSSTPAAAPRTSPASSRCSKENRPMITLYDLVFQDDRRPQPVLLARQVCAEAQGLGWRDEPMGFTEKAKIAFAQSQTVPVIHDGPNVVKDSWAIAQHLDSAYPEKPLFGPARQSRPFRRLVGSMAPCIAATVPDPGRRSLRSACGRVDQARTSPTRAASASGHHRLCRLPGARRARRAWPPSAPCWSRRGAC